jgi:hypothetical protein
VREQLAAEQTGDETGDQGAVIRRSVSCAVCVSPIDGDALYEPIGRDDALVPVCARCARDPVPDPPEPVRHAVREEPQSPRAQQIRERRDRLAREGICIWGASHGPAVERKLCASCAAKTSKRKRNTEETA